MHREFDPAAEPFERRSAIPLFAFTALLIALLLADLWPLLASWFGIEAGFGRELFGVRFALLAAVLGGARALFTSLDRALDGRIGADLAVAIACLAAILIGEPLVAAEVVVIGLVGECLEAFAFDRTQRALRKLAELFPTRTWVLRDGVETRIFTSQLQVGDYVVVKPGGRIPVDGVVLEGTSAVNAAALTGESLPQDKAPGDVVLAGCINQNGSLTIRADKIAKQTVAGRVIDLTAAALKEKAPLERYADRLAKKFLPIVLGLALAAFAFNLLLILGPWASAPKSSWAAAARTALYPALAVLVVACPCPLVLATPAAVIAALGRLAGTGVLLKGGAALERLADVKRIAFDKTGTLTTGDLELGDVLPFADASRDDLLRTAATVEQKSEHPLAKLILNSANDRGFALGSVDSFEAHPGGGVSAWIGPSRVLLGNRALLERQGVEFSPPARAALEHFDATGQTAVFVVRDGVILGALGARDTLRPEAAGVIEDLKALGLEVSLLTGDRAAAANSIATRAGIADVHAELLPAQKAEFFNSAIRNPHSAFVGDGINDAPALAKAAVGIAVGSGTEIAAETGDVVMMGEPLRPLPFLIRLSRQAVEIIRQNIVWFGFGVNGLGVIVAGFLWPLFAPSAAWFENAPLFGAIYHQIGSLLVLVNSMRLLTFEKPFANRFAHWFHDFDRWLNTLHFDDALHWLGHRWKPAAISIGVVGLAAWLLSGLTQVNANESGVVRRFGAVHSDLAPGLHLRWPWPVESTWKIRPAEARTVEIGFRRRGDAEIAELRQAAAAQDRLRGRDQSWASAHAFEIRRLSDESLFLTGDGNLVELLATVRYRIGDPRAFLLNGPQAEELIRTTAEAALRELAAGARFEDLLTTDRAAIESRAFGIISSRLPATLGVKLDGLTLHDLHPPQEVVEAYHAVAEAIQKRDRAINEAAADAVRVRRRAADDALYTVRLAEADAVKKVSDAAAAREVFLAWHAARSVLSKGEEEAFAKELVARISNGEERRTIELEIVARKKKLLDSRRALTDLRLTLSAALAALSGRDKIIIDAENVPGRRTLFLADPEAFRLPVLPKPEEK